LRHKIEAEISMKRCGHPDRFNRPSRSYEEASKWRSRVGIARLASRLSKVVVAGHPSDGENLKTSKFSLEWHVSLVI
jgi:hypothetical protein